MKTLTSGQQWAATICQVRGRDGGGRQRRQQAFRYVQWNDTNRIARVSDVDDILSVGRRHQALHSGITVTVWISSRRGPTSEGGVIDVIARDPRRPTRDDF